MSVTIDSIWDPNWNPSSFLESTQYSSETNSNMQRIYASILLYNNNMLDNYSKAIVANPNYVKVMKTASSLNDGLTLLLPPTIELPSSVKLLFEFGPTKIYDYSDKALLLITDKDWGKTNANLLKQYNGSFGVGFVVNGDKIPGWIFPKANATSIAFLRQLSNNAF